MDIMLDFDRLGAARSQLRTAIDAFDTAATFNNDLEKAVAKPDDRDELKNKVSDFESDWDDRRDDLKKLLEELHKGLNTIITEWNKWDVGTAKEFDKKPGR